MSGRFPETLHAARAGALWALETIYRSLAPAVLGYLRGQGAAEPEDLASEVFVGLIRNLPTFRGDERDFRAWAFTIAHRRLLDERRRLARRREEAVDPVELAGPLSAGVVGDAEEEALARVGERRAIEMLADLSPDQRDVLLLRIVAYLSVTEAAAVLGKTDGAVKALQRRGLLALARQFQREDVS